MIKKCFYAFISSFLLLSVSIKGFAAPYAQLSSSKDQLTTIENLNTPILVNMGDVDVLSGFSWDKNSNELTVKESGAYFLVLSGQVGAREFAKDIVKGGDLYLWIELNKKAVKNSNGWVFVSPTARSKTITDQTILLLKEGDVIRIKFSATSPSMGLITFPATELWPAAPGVTLTVFKIS